MAWRAILLVCTLAALTELATACADERELSECLERRRGGRCNSAGCDQTCGHCNNETLLPLTSRLNRGQTKATKSWKFCTGSCCGPGRRNRTCVFGNLLFRPPNRFSFLAEPGDMEPRLQESLVTFLHNRFANDGLV